MIHCDLNRFINDSKENTEMKGLSIEKARKIVSERRNSIFITVDEAGRPVDRVMWTAEVDDELNVYYATGINSAKVKRIESNPNALVLWISESGYLSLSGVAEVVTDRAVLDRLWRDSFARYFPGGKNDANYAVIRVTPREWTCSDNCDSAVEFVDLP